MKRFLPLSILLLAVLAVATSLLPPRNKDEYDLVGFSRLPTLVNGRIKPLDTVARTTLLMLQGRQRVSTPELSQPFVQTPIEWLADVFFDPAKADTYPVFKIESPEILELAGITSADTKIEYGSGAKRIMAVIGFLPSSKSRFSYNQLQPKLAEIDRQAQLADAVEDSLRTPFQKQAIHLREVVVLYQRLKFSLQLPDSPDFLGELVQFQKALPAGVAAVRAKQRREAFEEPAVKAMAEMTQRYEVMENYGYLLAIPPADHEPNPTAWTNTGRALLGSFATGDVNPNVMAYAALGNAWREKHSDQFNEVVRLYREQLTKRFKTQLQKSDIETRFNVAEPFYNAMVLYAWAFILAVFSWLKWPAELGRAAFWLVLVAWVLATAGIGARMWLEGRPPVTNLYSSALFVGWVAVALCLVLERLYRNAIGSVTAGVVGFSTLLIAHHLALAGDTLEMMRAVLDSNFWLATHVVTVTVGYAATFLAGFLAIIYVVRGVFTKSLDQATADALARMVYGIVCFATLFSFVGTVLGGIWADQSWGRFWGWDPKENGALIIVLWNALILHARWGGMVKQRGLMNLAIFGNIVTSWSWFGVNMLGVGLHSYGFMDAAFWWLLAFVASQLVLIAAGTVPLAKWRSFKLPA